jgi:polysaccharide lyase-like protein
MPRDRSSALAFTSLLAAAGAHVGCAGAPRSEASATPVRGAQAPFDASDCPVGRNVAWRGVFAGDGWLDSWGHGTKIDYGASNARVVGDARFGSVLRVVYPAGSSSSSYAREGHPLGGLEFKVPLPEGGASRSVFLSYWLRFAPNFRWVKGGKLPGLCGGSCPSGGALVSGFGGWSMRIMWRPGGAGEQYGYILPAQPYGTELGLGAWTFTTGEWHRVAQELVLNTDGAPNGESRVWFDVDPTAEPTFVAKNVTYRRDDTPADTLFFSTFFGGHDAEWATPVDTFVDFSSFVVCR